MRKITATAGSAVFLVIAPGVVAGLVPRWLTGWRAGAAYPAPVRITGAALTAAGAAALLTAFAQFAIQGRGTPAPPAPTEQLVVRGLYQYVRNPMYLAVLAVITGQALPDARPRTTKEASFCADIPAARNGHAHPHLVATASPPRVARSQRHERIAIWGR
jgi:protein-S-isoprenylcysteine O-methyltransferase Ste14